MRVLQRISALLGWVALAAVSTFLVLEAAEVVDGGWRRFLRGQIHAVAEPTMPRWAAVLVGLGLGVAALVVLAGQFVPYERSLRKPVVIDHVEEGDLLVTTRALQAALEHVVRQVGGVYESRVVVEKRRLLVYLMVDDATNVLETEAEARRLIDEGFWMTVGLEPRRIDFVISFGRAPVRAVA